MLKLRSILVTLFFVFTIQFLAVAQQRNFEAIESEKIAYITKQLKLSPSEAQRFFPIYNKYNEEMWELKKAKRGADVPKGVNSLNSNKRDVLAYDTKEIEIKKQYRNEFSKIIGQARASEFFQVIEDFNNYLRNTLESRQNSPRRR